MFVQIHQLRSFGVHLPNRDAAGLAKRTYYGGIERQRISAQCAKRALRKNMTLQRTQDGQTVSDTLEALAERLGLAMSVRSAAIGERVLKPQLVEEGMTEDEADTWSKAAMALWRKEREQGGDPDEEERAAPLVVGHQEIRLVTNVILACRNAGVESKDLRALFEKDSKLRKAPEPVQEAIRALRASHSHAGIDGALFGRFATGIAVSTVDRAVTVSDLLTVHPIHSISDFFSATDDLKTGTGADRGGSHIGTREMTDGLFYQHIVVDLRQVMENLACTEDDAAEVAAWLARAVYQTCPVGNRAFSRPVDMMVEVGSRQPRSLADAFADPVEVNERMGLPRAACERLVAFATEEDGLGGAPEYRSWLRDNRSEQRPAFEALSDAIEAEIKQRWGIVHGGGLMFIFSMRWRGPLMALSGESIDGYAQPIPIPSRSMVTGMLGAALGLGRAEHEQLQRLQDTLRHAVVVHREGSPVTDYQTADLGQDHMLAPMWWWNLDGQVGTMERHGGDSEGTRIQHRPLLADADMTVLVELLTDAPFSAEALLAALDAPRFPVYLGRSSCPPTARVAGSVLASETLEAAAEQVPGGRLYLPIELTQKRWGDVLVSLPTGRDWRTRQHGGSAMFVVR